MAAGAGGLGSSGGSGGSAFAAGVEAAAGVVVGEAVALHNIERAHTTITQQHDTYSLDPALLLSAAKYARDGPLPVVLEN